MTTSSSMPFSFCFFECMFVTRPSHPMSLRWEVRQYFDLLPPKTDTSWDSFKSFFFFFPVVSTSFRAEKMSLFLTALYSCRWMFFFFLPAISLSSSSSLILSFDSLCLFPSSLSIVTTRSKASFTLFHCPLSVFLSLRYSLCVMYFFFFPLKSKFVYLSLFPSTMKAFHRSCLLSKKRFFLSCLSLWTMKKFWNEIDIMASFLLFFTLFFFSSSLPLQFLSTSCQCPSASMTESCTHISLRKWWWWWRGRRKNRKGRKWRWEWEWGGYPLILFYWSDGFSLMFLLLTLIDRFFPFSYILVFSFDSFLIPLLIFFLSFCCLHLLQCVTQSPLMFHLLYFYSSFICESLERRSRWEWSEWSFNPLFLFLFFQGASFMLFVFPSLCLTWS